MSYGGASVSAEGAYRLDAVTVASARNPNESKYSHYGLNDSEDALMDQLEEIVAGHKRQAISVSTESTASTSTTSFPISTLAHTSQQPTCSRAVTLTTTNDDFSTTDGADPFSTSGVTALMLQPQCTQYSSLKTTRVLDQIVHCFVMGGECQLCWPQVVARLFGDLPSHTLQQAMTLLLMQNKLATREQLEILKLAGVVPTTIANCELISKSNAERLVSLLRAQVEEQPRGEQSNRLEHIMVAHECFGGCSGILYYNVPATHACIQCLHCHAAFNAENFCRHSHEETGKTVCHWGFDSSNWYFYLHTLDDESGSGNSDEQTWTRFVENHLRQCGR